MYFYCEVLANLGLTETVNLAAGALEKSKNGADIPDKVAFISNLMERGYLGDGGTFSACNQQGIYRVSTENPASISDMPKNSNGEYLYYYGVLSVQRIAGVITQVYKNHYGQTATRQSWDDGKVYNSWNVPYDSAINKPTAVDVGAITKKDADNHYVRQGLSGVIYPEGDLAWNSPTGAYLKDNGTHSSLIWHMGLNTGSASAAQFYFDFANGGIKYRSSRDNSGFEKPWARIYTDQDKPTAGEIGTLSLNEIVGIPMPWPQATAPSGWLKCNGQAFDKNIYPLLGQAYSSGILPDLRGEFIRGCDDGRGVDPSREPLSLQGFTVQGHTHPSGSYSRGSGTLLYTSVGMQTGGDRVFSETRENENAGTETRPRNIAFNYIVRAA